jgi:hypothetical protein
MSLFSPSGPRRFIGLVAVAAHMTTIVATALATLFPHEDD